MIVNVKGTRAGQDDGDLPSRQRYLTKEKKPSKAPFAVGAFLLGLAVYLKSALPSRAEPASDDSAPDAEPEEARPRLKLVENEMRTAELIATDAENSTGTLQDAEHAFHRIGSGSLLDERLPSARFLMVNSPSINYADFSMPRTDVSDLAAFQPALTVANDNIPSSGGSSGGRGPALEPTDEPRRPARPPVHAVADDDSEDDEDRTGTGRVGGSRNEDEYDGDEDEEGENNYNRAPRSSGAVYLADVFGCGAVLIGLTKLLANASDPDGDVLSIKNLTVSSGNITQTATGWLYDPDALGPVTVRFEITDGKLSIVQYAYFSVEKNPPIVGTEGDNILVGTNCADVIEAKGGNDLVDGRSGNDTIEAGAGDDHVVGGAGNDVIYGGDGDDIILGQEGDDEISGGEGNDRLFGDEGDDTIFGDAGEDEIHGGEGRDLLFGGTGNDTVFGDAGDDIIHGEDGDDVLSGGEGNDLVAAGAGNDSLEGGSGADLLFDETGQDTVRGGAGDDRVVAALDEDRDTYDGGEGAADALDLTATEAGVSVDLAAGSAEGEEIGDNAVTGFEIVEGGAGNDSLAGSEGGETLSGAGGEDLIEGRAGDDTISGGDGDDRLLDGTGEDSVTGGAGNDVVSAAADGNDDAYEGSDGEDVLDYSQSEELIIVDLVTMTASGADIGEDVIGGFESVIGGSGDDSFLVGQQAMILEGGSGDDLFEFVPPPTSESEPVHVLHEIVDFTAGDRIRMSKFDIFERIVDELESQFEAIYGDQINASETAIRYRYETSDSVDRTVLEADIDHDRIYETTVILEGRHALVIVDQTT